MAILPAEQQKEYSALYNQLNEAGSDIEPLEWEYPTGPAHLTLAYLGDVPEECMGAAIAAAKSVLDDVLSFPVEGTEYDRFPGHDGGKTPIIVRYKENAQLSELQERVEKALAPFRHSSVTVYPEYKPHTTIGYSTRPISQAMTDKPVPTPLLRWHLGHIILTRGKKIAAEWNINAGKVVAATRLDNPVIRIYHRENRVEFRLEDARITPGGPPVMHGWVSIRRLGSNSWTITTSYIGNGRGQGYGTDLYLAAIKYASEDGGKGVTTDDMASDAAKAVRSRLVSRGITLTPVPGHSGEVVMFGRVAPSIPVEDMSGQLTGALQRRFDLHAISRPIARMITETLKHIKEDSTKPRTEFTSDGRFALYGSFNLKRSNQAYDLTTRFIHKVKGTTLPDATTEGLLALRLMRVRVRFVRSDNPDRLHAARGMFYPRNRGISVDVLIDPTRPIDIQKCTLDAHSLLMHEMQHAANTLERGFRQRAEREDKPQSSAPYMHSYMTKNIEIPAFARQVREVARVNNLPYEQAVDMFLNTWVRQEHLPGEWRADVRQKLLEHIQRTGSAPEIITAARKVWWHGTTSRNLRGILKRGLIPFGTSLVYDDENDSDHGRSLKTYGGIYMTDNWMTAYGAAGTAAGLKGGNRLMVGVTYEDRTSSALADEDDIVPMFTGIIGRRAEDLKGKDWGIDLRPLRRHMGEKGPIFRPKFWPDIIRIFQTNPVDSLADSIVRRIARSWPSAQGRLERRPEQVRVAIEKVIRALALNLVWINARSRLAELQDGADEATLEAIRNPPEVLTKSHDNLVEAVRLFGVAIPEIRGGSRYDHSLNSIRAMEPIGFRGRNRILAIIEVRPDSDERSYHYDIVNHYGKTLNDEFMAKYTKHVGPTPRPMVKGSMETSVRALMENTRERFHLETLWLTDRTASARVKSFSLDMIKVDPEHAREGYASKAMETMVQWADKHGYIMALSPSTEKRLRPTFNQLVRWYKRFGFVMNKGKDFRFKHTMIRFPQGESVTGAVSGIIGWKADGEGDWDGRWNGIYVATVIKKGLGKYRGMHGTKCTNKPGDDDIHWAPTGDFTDIDEAIEAAEVCPWCGDTPCNGFSEPTSEVRKASVVFRWKETHQERFREWFGYWNGKEVATVDDGGSEERPFGASAWSECEPGDPQYVHCGDFKTLRAAQQAARMCPNCGDSPCAAISELTEEITASAESGWHRRESSWAWISPEGEVFPCKNHNSWAKKQVNDRPVEYKWEHDRPDEWESVGILQKEGWVKCSNRLVYGVYDWNKVSDAAKKAMAQAAVDYAHHWRKVVDVEEEVIEVYDDNSHTYVISDFVHRYGGKALEDELYRKLQASVTASAGWRVSDVSWAWIDPHGEIHDLKGDMHHLWARSYCQRELGEEDINTYDAMALLARKGWVKCSNRVLYGAKNWKAISQAAKHTMVRAVIEYVLHWKKAIDIEEEAVEVYDGDERHMYTIADFVQEFGENGLTEELYRRLEARVAGVDHIQWKHYDGGLRGEGWEGFWQGQQVADVLKRTTDFWAQHNTFCDPKYKKPSWEDVGAFPTEQEAKENAAMCPLCGDDPCSGWSEPTEETVQAKARTASAQFRWEKVPGKQKDYVEWVGYWNGIQVAIVDNGAAGKEKFTCYAFAGCNGGKPEIVYVGNATTLKKAKELASICMYCGDDPCGAVSEPTDEVQASVTAGAFVDYQGGKLRREDAEAEASAAAEGITVEEYRRRKKDRIMEALRTNSWMPKTLTIGSTDDRVKRARLFQDDDFDDDRLPTVMDIYPNIKAANPRIKGSTVTVWRAVNSAASTSIRPGDWVALRKAYAERHTGGRDTVISLEVPVGDVVWAGTDEHEWFYAPKTGNVTGAVLPKKGNRFKTHFVGMDDGRWEATEEVPMGSERRRWDWGAWSSLSSKNEWRNLSVDGATEHSKGFRKALTEIVKEYPELKDWVISFDGPYTPVSDLLGGTGEVDWANMVFLHGTSTTFLEDIKKKGLRPRGNTGVAPTHGAGVGAHPSNPEAVYLTTQMGTARFACADAVRQHGGEPMILKIKGINPVALGPDEDSREVTPEKSLARMGCVAYFGTIKPGLITFPTITGAWDGRMHSYAWIDPHGVLHELPKGMNHEQWLSRKRKLTYEDAIYAGWVRLITPFEIESKFETIPGKVLDTVLQMLVDTAAEQEVNPETRSVDHWVQNEYTKSSLADFVRKHGGRTWEDKLFKRLTGSTIPSHWVTLYHATSPEAASAIVKTGAWKTKEPGLLYFSNFPDGWIDGYGTARVVISINPHWISLDDEFPSGEESYTIPQKHWNKIKIIRAINADGTVLGAVGDGGESAEEEQTQQGHGKRNSDPFPTEFREEMAGKGKVFQNPETQNKVVFDSLPWPEQLKQYKKWMLTHSKGRKHKNSKEEKEKAEKEIGLTEADRLHEPEHEQAAEDAAEKGSGAEEKSEEGAEDGETGLHPAAVPPEEEPDQELPNGEPAATGTNLHPDTQRSFTHVAEKMKWTDDEKKAIQDVVFKQPAAKVDAESSAFRDNKQKYGFAMAVLIFFANVGLQGHKAVQRRVDSLIQHVEKVKAGGKEFLRIRQEVIDSWKPYVGLNGQNPTPKPSHQIAEEGHAKLERLQEQHATAAVSGIVEWKKIHEDKHEGYWCGQVVCRVERYYGKWEASRIERCAGKKAWVFDKPVDDLEEAKESAEMCLRCHDVPCNVLSEPTEEVSAAVSGLINWKLSSVDKDLFCGWWGEIITCRVHKLSPSMFSADHLVSCDRARPYWKEVAIPDNLAEAQEMAEICPKCGDTPCNGFSEPTDETVKAALSGIVQWKQADGHGDTYYGRWHDEIVSEVTRLGPETFRAQHACMCVGNSKMSWGNRVRWKEIPGSFQLKTLEEAQEAAETCPKCGDTPCSEYSEPTEEVKAAVSGIIDWRPSTPSIYRGYWNGIQVALVRDDDDGLFFINTAIMCTPGSKNHVWKSSTINGTLEEAKEDAEICPKCGDTPCNGFSEPTEEVKARVSLRTASPIFHWNTWKGPDFNGWTARWMGIEVGQVYDNSGDPKKPFVAMSQCNCYGDPELWESGPFKTLKEAQEAAESCVKCGDTPCEALSEPTEEVEAKTRRTASLNAQGVLEYPEARMGAVDPRLMPNHVWYEARVKPGVTEPQYAQFLDQKVFVQRIPGPVSTGKHGLGLFVVWLTDRRNVLRATLSSIMENIEFGDLVDNATQARCTEQYEIKIGKRPRTAMAGLTHRW